MLGHYNIAKAQTLMSAKGLKEEPPLISRVPGTCTYNIPLCPPCLADKARKIPLHNKHSNPAIKHSDVIKDSDLLPGTAVSIDQYECRVKGRLPNTKGKEDPHKILCGGTIFVDHGSSKTDIFH